jgi:hypothetical protein
MFERYRFAAVHRFGFTFSPSWTRRHRLGALRTSISSSPRGLSTAYDNWACGASGQRLTVQRWLCAATLGTCAGGPNLSAFGINHFGTVSHLLVLRELHQRTADLTESLAQQTATSEVLQVISSSPGERRSAGSLEPKRT